VTYACMSEAELALWREGAVEAGRRMGYTAQRPCTDCPIWFATERRAEGCCNGTPGPRPGPTRRSPDVPLMGRGRPYATEEERIAARRKTWRESKRRGRPA